jgi:hypothetical protein
MSEHPRSLRADLLVMVAVVIAIVVAALSPRWRSGSTGAIGGAGASTDLAAGADPSNVPKLDSRNPGPSEFEPSQMRHHRSPFDDAVTARAETLCVHMVESQVGFALKQPVTVSVNDRYGTGNEDDGRGVYLIFEGIARTPAAKLSAWRCTMKSYGAYPGTPVIAHVEPQ